MSQEIDYYQVLGIDKDASLPEIKAAYHKLAGKWHPDRFHGKSPAEQKEAHAKFREIDEAYKILSDPEKRHQYDHGKKSAVTDNPRGFLIEVWDNIFVQGLKKPKPRRKKNGN